MISLFFPEQISNKFEELTNNITVKMDNERDIMAKLKGTVLIISNILFFTDTFCHESINY
jgi:hypothetical protein